MAEAAAIVGVIASIAFLVEPSAKVVSRLHDFTSKFSDVPESFRSLWIRLPLLTVIFQHIQSRAEADSLPHNAANALKAVVDNQRTAWTIISSNKATAGAIWVNTVISLWTTKSKYYIRHGTCHFSRSETRTLGSRAFKANGIPRQSSLQDLGDASA